MLDSDVFSGWDTGIKSIAQKSLHNSPQTPTELTIKRPLIHEYMRRKKIMDTK